MPMYNVSSRSIFAIRHCLLKFRLFPTSRQASSFPEDAEVVICGGGVIGSSIALHLREKGWKNIVLLEQGK